MLFLEVAWLRQALKPPHPMKSESWEDRIAVFGKDLSRIGGARGWQAGGSGGESVRESMSEELREWYRSFGDVVKREDPGDSLIQCVDRTERGQRQLQGLEVGGRRK